MCWWGRLVFRVQLVLGMGCVAYDFVIAVVVGLVVALCAVVAVLEVLGQFLLAGAWETALCACYGEFACCSVLVELGLAGVDALAAFALKVVVHQVVVEGGLIWAIEVTAWFKAMLVFFYNSQQAFFSIGGM